MTVWGKKIGVAALLLLCCAVGSAQTARTPFASRQATGTLTVTATVMPSVGVITGPNGEQTLVYANFPDARDNVSFLAVKKQGAPAATADPAAKPKKTK